MNFSDLIKQLPAVAGSPYAIVAYIVLIAAWTVVVLNIRRNKNLLKKLSDLPRQDRLKALREEMGTAPIKEGLSAEQFIKSKIHRYYFLGFIALCTMVVLLSIIASIKQSDRATLFKNEQHGQLRLVDVRIVEPVESDTNRFPKLDILLRNVGEVALVKRAIFNVVNVWEWRSIGQPFALESSWDYTVELPISGAPYRHEVDIAQDIVSGGTDRFTFRLGNNAPPSLTSYVFKCSVDLIYDEDDKKISTPEIIFLTVGPRVVAGASYNAEPVIASDVDSHNYLVLKDIGEFKGIESYAWQSLRDEWPTDVISDFIDMLQNDDEDDILYSTLFLGKVGVDAKDALRALEEVATNNALSEECRSAAKNSIEVIQRSNERIVPDKIEYQPEKSVKRRKVPVVKTKV